MKRVLFFLAFALYAGFAFSGKITVTNSGFTFSPDSISINVNDTVDFQLAAIHTVVEVNQATWEANGNTHLAGGFLLPFGGGQVTGLTAGIHYYVCGPHASLGMKGRIFVNSGLGLNNVETSSSKISIAPNPTSGKFSVRWDESFSRGGITQEFKLDIYNMLGAKILSEANLQPETEYNIDLTSFPDGVYFLTIVNGRKTDAVRIVKR